MSEPAVLVPARFVAMLAVHPHKLKLAKNAVVRQVVRRKDSPLRVPHRRVVRTKVITVSYLCQRVYRLKVLLVTVLRLLMRDKITRK